MCMEICTPCACLVPIRSEEGIRSTGTGVTCGCEPQWSQVLCKSKSS